MQGGIAERLGVMHHEKPFALIEILVLELAPADFLKCLDLIGRGLERARPSAFVAFDRARFVMLDKSLLRPPGRAQPLKECGFLSLLDAAGLRLAFIGKLASASRLCRGLGRVKAIAFARPLRLGGAGRNRGRRLGHFHARLHVSAGRGRETHADVFVRARPAQRRVRHARERLRSGFVLGLDERPSARFNPGERREALDRFAIGGLPRRENA